MEQATLIATEPKPPIRFRTVFRIALAAFAPFVVAHLWLAYGAVPMFAEMFNDLAVDLPGPTAVLMTLSRLGLLGPLLLAVDAAAFYVMYRLAKRYWIGLLFAPVALSLALLALFVPLLYIPVFESITLVR